MNVSDSNPYAPPASAILHEEGVRSYFKSGLLYSFAGWTAYVFSRMVPAILGGTCSLPSQGLGGVLMLGFFAPAGVGLFFMYWAERGKKPTKRLFGFAVGLVLFPLTVLLPIQVILHYFKPI